jgi:hypothetical protein
VSIFHRENNSCNAADLTRFLCGMKRKQYSELRAQVSQEFYDLAKRFNIEPEHLAFCILSYFAEHHERLCLVSNDPADARKGTR